MLGLLIVQEEKGTLAVNVTNCFSGHNRHVREEAEASLWRGGRRGKETLLDLSQHAKYSQTGNLGCHCVASSVFVSPQIEVGMMKMVLCL